MFNFWQIYKVSSLASELALKTATAYRPLKFKKVHLFSCILLIGFLCPTFMGVTKGIGGSKYFGEMLLTFTILNLIFIGLFILRTKVYRKSFDISLTLFALFVWLILLSLFRDRYFSGYRDFLEFYRPVYALGIFLLTFSIPWNTETLKRHVIKPFKCIFIFMILYSLFEALSGPIGVSISTFLYKDSRSVLLNKATGSFGVTYYFGAFMIFPLSYYFFQTILIKQRRLVSLLLCLGCLAVILLSQSRTIFLSITCILLYIFFVYGFYYGLKRKVAFYSAFAAFGTVLAFSWPYILDYAKTNFGYLYSGLSFLISKGISATGTGSANIRFQQLLWAWDHQDTIPLFGVGIGKGSDVLLESFYALYLYRYGLIGIFLYVLIALAFLILSYRAYKLFYKIQRMDIACFFMAYHIFIVSLPVSSLSSVVTDQPRIALLYYGLGGILCRIAKDRTFNSKSETFNAATPQLKIQS